MSLPCPARDCRGLVLVPDYRSGDRIQRCTACKKLYQVMLVGLWLTPHLLPVPCTAALMQWRMMQFQARTMKAFKELEDKIKVEQLTEIIQTWPPVAPSKDL